MPPELVAHLPWITAAVGAAAGILLATLILAARHGRVAATMHERLRAEQHRAAELETRLARSEDEGGRHEREANELRARVGSLQAKLDAEAEAGAARQALLGRVEARLAETFKSLATEALAAHGEQVRELAAAALRHSLEQASGELDHRRQADGQAVAPLAEVLEQFQTRLGETELLRAEATTELRSHVRAITETQAKLLRETTDLAAALREATAALASAPLAAASPADDRIDAFVLPPEFGGAEPPADAPPADQPAGEGFDFVPEVSAAARAAARAAAADLRAALGGEERGS